MDQVLIKSALATAGENRSMKKMFLFLVFVVSFSLLGCSGEQPAENALDENEVRALVLAKMNEYGVPGVQVCIKDQLSGKKLIVSQGYANLESQTPLRDTTQIKIGSITKSFTALGILRLAQKGLLALDDRLGDHLEIADERYRQITIRQLMNMDSGLRGYLNDDPGMSVVNEVIADPARHFSSDELVGYGFQLTDNLGMTGEGVFHYNNTNYILLGMIIERVTQGSYADFLRTEIIEPLGLSATYLPANNSYDANVSSGYHIDFDDATTENYSALDLSYVWSAGALISTASDLCDWIIAVASGKVVSGEALTRVFSGLTVDGSAQYTAGLINEPERLWHNGTVLGYHGEMCYLKNRLIAVTVLSNCTLAGVAGDPVKEIMNGIIEMLATKRP